MTDDRKVGDPVAFAITSANRMRQLRERASYDHAVVFDILDRGLVAHVAFIEDDRPFVIPMAYGRDGARLLIHGSSKARLLNTANQRPVSIAVTLMDGIVVARSMFDCSMNYRAVVIHGVATEVESDDDRLYALRCISEHALPGRWLEARAPSSQELKATSILEVRIEAASAKIRSGPPSADNETNADTTWMGVLPIVTSYGDPIAECSVPLTLPVPPSVVARANIRVG